MTMTSPLHADRHLPPGRFLVLIYVRGWVDPRAGRIRSIEKIHLVGTTSRDLPACSIVPQPSMLPGRATAQAVSRWLPTAAAWVRVRAGMWGLWWTKRHWVRFSLSTSVSPANHHSTSFSIIIITITRGCHNRPIGGRSAEWTQLDSTLHYTN
jgi:hypothetical protein